MADYNGNGASGVGNSSRIRLLRLRLSQRYSPEVIAQAYPNLDKLEDQDISDFIDELQDNVKPKPIDAKRIAAVTAAAKKHGVNLSDPASYAHRVAMAWRSDTYPVNVHDWDREQADTFTKYDVFPAPRDESSTSSKWVARMNELEANVESNEDTLFI